MYSRKRHWPYEFEHQALLEHINFYLEIFINADKLNLKVGELRLLFILLEEQRTEKLDSVIIYNLKQKFPKIKFELRSDTEKSNTYYSHLRFQIFAKDTSGYEYLLTDGGFTNWTQKLLSNKKERLLTSGIGSERLCVCFI
ncbi:MAG: hypothetical protein A2V66_11745 [Ignavibacteria bacterium RBG_13_36_8]|nr:MAG: hypothetical protein A2V66_11745 [Ignavibacteria bacterium RBG_13_36_8]